MNGEAFPSSADAAAGADPLRIVACGSQGDGKSTLLSRLPPAGDPLDPASRREGREARGQDGVAWRVVATPRSRFTVADMPSDARSLPTLAAGAAGANLALLLVDASKGLLAQTRRHALIVSLLGVRSVALAVNKMDLVGFDEGTYRAIAAAFQDFAAGLGIEEITAIPVSAAEGDNVASRSERMAWYAGPTLLEHLESVAQGRDAAAAPFRLAVEETSSGGPDSGGLSGPVVSGRIGVGDAVVAATTGRQSQVEAIRIGDRPATQAVAGQSALLTLRDDLGIGPGDLLAAADARPTVSDQFAGHLIWLDAEHLLPGRQYLLTCLTRTVPAQVTELKYRLDIDSLEHNAAKVLEPGEVGVVNISTGEAIAFDPFEDNRASGAFRLLDRFTHATVAIGTISFALRRASNIHWQALDVDRSARAQIKNQKPTVLWFTGLSGSGKSTIANLVEKQLFARGLHTVILDGDNVRHGLNRDLGFTDADRVENIRRVAETAKLMADAGLLVLVSFISPFRSERDMARGILPDGEFVEIFVDTPIELCQARDPKGLYARAVAGEIKNFTGIDSPYEEPAAPDIRLRTADHAAEELAAIVIAYLSDRGRLSSA